VKAAAAGVVGLSYESIGKREEAIQHLKLALELAPAQENSFLALAFLYEKAQRFKDAVEVIERGRRQIPGSINFLLPLGNNLVWAEQYQAGIDVLNELIRQKPDAAEAYVRLAEAYRNTGHPELETRTLRGLARVNPDYPMVHVLTARAMLTVDPLDAPGILAELALAEKKAPRDADVFYLRGKVYIAMNRYPDALIALKRAIELRPMDPAPYYQLGLTYRKLGRSELARETLERMQHLKETPAAAEPEP
jgi:tetratricopeptide (TPR) repeat protein